jgi:hypothetical protein
MNLRSLTGGLAMTDTQDFLRFIGATNLRLGMVPS